MKYHFFWSLVLVALLGCREEIGVLAPEKELYGVWGILDPEKDVQYVKIGQVFQAEEDALAYPEENDLSVAGFEVSIHGDDQVWEGTIEEIPRDPGGSFGASQRLYRFETPPGARLKAEETYELIIRRPGVDSILISATTTIPSAPDIFNPSGPVYLPRTNDYLLPTIDFEDDYAVIFRRGTGFGFEVRVLVDYFENGVPQTARWGPTKVFNKPGDCEADGIVELCYQIPEAVVSRGLSTTFSKVSGTIFVNDTIPKASQINQLSSSVAVEVTAIDSIFSTYITAQDPFGFGLNLLMDPPVVTNMSGDHVGIFGSIHRARNYIILDACTKYRAGITNYIPGNCF